MLLRLAVAALLCGLTYGRPSPVLADAPQAPTSRPHVFIAEGTASVVGGNVVSARRRALHRAQRAALERAAKALTPQLDALKARALAGHLPRLLRTYRVLKEAREGQAYHVQVEARFDLRRLRRLIGVTTAKALGAGSSPPGSKPLLAISLLAGPSQGSLRQMVASELSAQLSSAGTALRAAAVAKSRAGAIAAAPLASAVLELRVEAKPAPGVRGLALIGAAARWQATLATRAGVQLVSSAATGWGRGAAAGLARQQASRRGLRAVLAVVVPVLARRFPATSAAVGQASIVLRGLSSLSRYRLVVRRLRRAGYRVRLRHLVGVDATISVPAGKLAAASRLLEARPFLCGEAGSADGRAIRGFSLRRVAGSGPRTFRAQSASVTTPEAASPGS
ncbi:MAG: hypothetical protein CSA24_00355 [Deltaproteobacteria bacterium]|nr:MAG: hypothetical protein CSB49_03045 [Pseudomonadota bacterium]PIE66347.1 MAG: hypothetical protein CSA24_00355 [Deltaproteobacteria bacterium]